VESGGSRTSLIPEALVTETAAFRFLMVLLLVGFVAHRAYTTHKNPPAEDEIVDWLQPGTASRLASILSVMALASTAIDLSFPGIRLGLLPLPMWARWFGVVLAAAGFFLLEWSHRSLGREWSDQPRMTQSQRLVQSGPYRWIHQVPRIAWRGNTPRASRVKGIFS